jgi:alkylation response protein AidB-like acyl-CoA dehydrogenase
MDVKLYELTEEQMMAREAIRRFAEREVAPLVEEAEAEGKFPIQLFRKMGALGYLCIRYPLEMGGGGADKVTECIASEELNRICAGIAAGLMVQGGLATAPIYRFGSEALKERILLPAIRGEKIGAFALTEPDVGSDAASLKTRATRDGDYYVLRGSKTFITNGPICDYAVVAATVDPSKKAEGISLFVVEKGTPGFIVTRKLDKVGNRSAETGELLFDECRIPKSNLIGDKEGKGFEQIRDTLMSGRITYGGRSTGVAQAAYEASLKYARDRIQFGRPIIEFQVTRFKLAQMAMKIDIMRSYTYRIARLYDKGQKVMREASMVKLFCAETLQEILSQAMQIHGGYGYTTEYPVERFWRDGRLFSITEGTSEIHHMVIARELGF